MKKIIKYISSLFFIFMLFPVSVIAGENIKMDCTSDLVEPFSFLVDSDGGKLQLFNKEMDVIILKDKLFGIDNMGFGFLMYFKDGKLNWGGTKVADCKFSNLEVLENNNNENIVAHADEGKIIQLLESIKKQQDTTSGADEGKIIQFLELIKIQQDTIEEKLDKNNLDALTKHNKLPAHEHGEKISVPCSARIELDIRKNTYTGDKWQGYLYVNVAFTDSLLKSHNALNEIDATYPMPIEVEITTKDGEKIPMIVGYNLVVEGGNLTHSFQAGRDVKTLFDVLGEAQRDENMRKYGEFPNANCSFYSHSVQYH